MASQISNLLRARNLCGLNVKLISTFSFLCQEPLLANEQEQGAESASGLPPNPATGSPLYNENWRSPLPYHSPSSSSLSVVIPAVDFALGQSQVRNLDVNSLSNSLTSLMTASRWFDMKNQFETWIRSMDSRGKLNRPTVELYNYYLRANHMMGASNGELLDLAAQMDEFQLSPNTASFNIVLESMFATNEYEAAEKILQRMEALNMTCPPNDESYDLVIKVLFRNNQVDAALKHVDEALQRGLALSSTVFSMCVDSCLKNNMLDKMASIFEKCQSMDKNKTLSPLWNSCIRIMNAAIRGENPKLTYIVLQFIHKLVIKSQSPGLPLSLSVGEPLIIPAMKLAVMSFNSNLLDHSWLVLCRSLRNSKPSPQAYIARINSYASLGNLEKSLAALGEFETTCRNLDEKSQEELLCPFSALYPLVVACSSKGFETLDLVYFQLEKSSRSHVPYKSVTALNCVILGCGNTWDLVRAYQTFEAIGSAFGLNPNVHSYNCLMYAYGRQKGVSEAEKVFNHMVSVGVKPNEKSHSLLVDAHLAVRNPKAALSVVEQMVSAGFKPTRELLKKIRRRCVREMDFDSNDAVLEYSKRFGLPLGTEVQRDYLFKLDYSTV